MSSNPSIPLQNCQDVLIQQQDQITLVTTLEEIEAELASAETTTFEDFAIFQDVHRSLQSIRERKLIELLSRAKSIIHHLTHQEQIQQRKIKGLIQQNALCLTNISSLFLTAKNEIERKNNLIASLQQQLDSQSNQPRQQQNQHHQQQPHYRNHNHQEQPTRDFQMIDNRSLNNNHQLNRPHKNHTKSNEQDLPYDEQYRNRNRQYQSTTQHQPPK